MILIAYVGDGEHFKGVFFDGTVVFVSPDDAVIYKNQKYKRQNVMDGNKYIDIMENAEYTPATESQLKDIYHVMDMETA